MAKKTMLVLLTELLKVLEELMKYSTDWNSMMSPAGSIQIVWRTKKISAVNCMILAGVVEKNNSRIQLKTHESAIQIIEGSCILYREKKSDNDTTTPIEISNVFLKEGDVCNLDKVQTNDYFRIEPEGEKVAFVFITRLKEGDILYKKELHARVSAQKEKEILEIIKSKIS